MNLFQKLLRLIAAPLAFSLVFANVAYAADPAFNNNPGVGDQRENEFLTGFNVTKGETVPHDPVDASAGDEVQVVVYYHNAVEGTTARNTKIRVQLPTSASNKHVIKGFLSADNAATVTGTIVNGQEIGNPDFTINSAATTTLSFVPGSVKWYPNATQHPGETANLPGGQNGDAIKDGGINIGDITGCFQYAGFVTFKVKLAGVSPTQPTLSLSKLVRQADTNSVFAPSNRVNPGNPLIYQLTVSNTHATAAATSVRVRDILPNGVTLDGPIQLLNGSTTTNLSGNITATEGVLVINSLPAQSSVKVVFRVKTATTFQNNDCIINKAIASASNVGNRPEATAQTCFDVPTQPILELKKFVRKAGSGDDFIATNRVNPGTQIEYQILVRNMDGGQTIRNVRVKDVLPQGVTFVGPVVLHRGSATINLSGNLTGDGVVIPELNPSETVQLRFLANTTTTFTQDQCVVNKVTASSPDAANTPEATASTCFEVKKTPPTTSSPSPTPAPELPRTGPQAALLLLAGATGIGGSMARYFDLKRKLKKSAHNLDIR